MTINEMIIAINLSGSSIDVINPNPNDNDKVPILQFGHFINRSC